MTAQDAGQGKKIVYLRDSLTLLQCPAAVALLRAHGLEPKQTLTAGDEENVIAILIGLQLFGLADAARFPNLKTAARFGAGYDNVATADLWRERRIAVTCTPDLATRDVAEFAVGLIIAAGRGVARDSAGLGGQPSRWRVIDRTPALRDSTIGIVGAGAIGLETLRLIAPFAKHILLWNRSARPLDLGEAAGKTERVMDILELARRCDVVSLHVALAEETRGLIGEKFFAEVQAAGRSLALINTARGEIVDEEALLKALDEGIVLDAATDVWSAEGAQTNSAVEKLRAHPSVIATSHIGSHTHGVMERYAMQCARNVVAVVEQRTGDIARFVVRPD